MVDTSVLARYLVGDGGVQAAQAAALIDSDLPLQVSIVAVAELGYLLTHHYRLERDDVVGAMVGLLQRANVAVREVPTDTVVDALALCAPGRRVSFADAMQWAVARASPAAPVWTFDARFPSEGIEVRIPGSARSCGGV